MAQIQTELKIQSGSKTFNFSSSDNYTEVLDIEQEVDNTDGFIDVVSFSSTKGTNTVPSSKGFCIYNSGPVPVEIQYKTMGWKDNGSNADISNSVDVSGDGASRDRFISFILPVGKMKWEPNARLINYATDESAGNAVTLDNLSPASITAGALFRDSGINLGAALDEPDTAITVTDLAVFKIGDLVQVGTNDTTATRIEVMRVTAMSGTDGSGTLTVDRGLFGTLKADKDSQTDATEGAVSGANVFFPFFNMLSRYNKFSTSRTDSNGRFKAMNFFGYGRNITAIADGIVPGTVALKYYTKAFQELGLQGITASTETGLTAGSTYYFFVAVDGGSAYEVAVTVDTNNTKFGGANGFVAKVNQVFKQQYYTTGATLNGVRVSCAIVGGDLRFTSGSRLSTSAIALTAGTSGADTTTEIFAQAIGRFPILAKIKGAVASELPKDTIFIKDTYNEVKNNSIFVTDDGVGNLIGASTIGTINYETGELNFSGPPEAEFVVSASYESAHSGGVSTASNNFNNIVSIGARSMNSKVNTNIKVKVFS